MLDQKYVAEDLLALVEAPQVRMLDMIPVDANGSAAEASEL